MNEKVEQVNKLLLQGEPDNISVDEHASYASTGYRPQSIIDAMNEVFWNAWGFEEICNEIILSKDGVPTLALCQVSVRLADLDFQPVAWGQANIVKGNIGDAKKGAQTDAIKKALSYFSIGNRAYHGLLSKEEKRNGNGNISKSHDQALHDLASPQAYEKSHENDEPTQEQMRQLGELLAKTGQQRHRPKSRGQAENMIRDLLQIPELKP